ncbi:MAG TPA: TAXI family TRAP transporter solute-binding subunit, partial [Burkholderiales bacterium]|nr:TAXI family TRAP transporter solute-binding subunit [Burkholderiales bacterium]
MEKAGAPRAKRKIGAFGVAVEIPQVSWRDFIAAVVPVLLLTLLALWVAFKFVRPAPPDTIIITSGTKGSSYATAAEKYRVILERNGVKLQILESEGSLDNLHRLRDPAFKVDVGFVQGGLVVDGDAGQLVSLGSLFYVPLVVFYRGAAPVDRLSDFKGKRLAIGREGSGTHFLNVQLLRANGVDKQSAQLLEISGEAAAAALLSRKVDAVLLMGDAATPAIMRQLVHTRGIRMM